MRQIKMDARNPPQGPDALHAPKAEIQGESSRDLVKLSDFDRDQACKCFEPDFAVDQLLFRDGEIQSVRKFVQGASPSTLFVVGKPGIGKTVLCRRVVDELGKGSRAIYVNGLTYSSFDQFEQDLNSRLEAGFFRGKKKRGRQATQGVGLVVVDEVDHLLGLNKDRAAEFLKRFNGSGLKLIGISNTVDELEQLEQRQQTSLGADRVVVQPYSKEQMQAILRQRVDSANRLYPGAPIQFEQNAVAFLSAKFSKLLGGDLREVFHLCKSIVSEQLLREGRALVRLEDVQQKLYARQKDMAKAKYVRDLPYDQKLLLCTVLYLVREEELQFLPLQRVLRVYNGRRQEEMLGAINLPALRGILEYLVVYGLVELRRGRKEQVRQLVEREVVLEAVEESALRLYL